MVWGGDAKCEHDYGGMTHKGKISAEPSAAVYKEGYASAFRCGHEYLDHKADAIEPQGNFCRLCGAWRGCLGLEPTIELYVEHMVTVFREVRRVLRSDGTLWLNIGDCYATSFFSHSSIRSIAQSMGDWCKEGQRLPKADRTKRGAADSMAGLKPKDLIGMPWRVAFALQAQGWWLRSAIVWAKGVSFCPTYSGSVMPECLDPKTQVFIKRKGWISRATLAHLSHLPELPEILSPSGWVQVRRVWKTRKPAMEILAGKVERIVCSPDHRFPISSDRRRLKARIEAASKIRHTGYADYFLYAPIGQFLTPSITEWMGAPLSRELGYIIGAFAAEGGKDGTQGWRLKFTLGIHESDFADRLRSCFRGLSIRWSEKENCEHHYRHFRVSHEWLTRTLTTFVHGDCRSKNLNIELILNAPAEFRQGILDGYVDGDGSDRGNAPGWVATSASRRLRDDIGTLSSSLGIITSKGGNKQFDNRTDKTNYSHSLWTPYMTRRKVKSGTNGVFQVPPRARRMLNEKRDMIDLEVDGGLFLIGDGLITHNSCRDRPTSAYEMVFLMSKAPHYYYDAEAVREPSAVGWNDSSFTSAQDVETKHRLGMGERTERAGRNLRNVWCINPEPFSDAHFASWPTKLVEPCVKAGSSHKACGARLADGQVCGAPWERMVEKKAATMNIRIRDAKAGRLENKSGHSGKASASAEEIATYGDEEMGYAETTGWRPTCEHTDDTGRCVVLDPFAGGSGRVGLVCKRLGRDFIGIELSEAYCEMSRKRLEKAVSEEIFR